MMCAMMRCHIINDGMGKSQLLLFSFFSNSLKVFGSYELLSNAAVLPYQVSFGENLARVQNHKKCNNCVKKHSAAAVVLCF